MPKQNQPKYINKNVTHHNVAFMLKRHLAVEVDKAIEKIRQHMNIERKQEYLSRIREAEDDGRSNYFIARRYATRGQVLLELIDKYNQINKGKEE